MFTKIGLGILALALFAAPVKAAVVTLAWIGHEAAAAYCIYYSTDGGATWSKMGDNIPQPTQFPADKQIVTTLTDVPEKGLVLFYASALDGHGNEWAEVKMGAWYNHELTGAAPAALRIKNQ